MNTVFRTLAIGVPLILASVFAGQAQATSILIDSYNDTQLVIVSGAPAGTKTSSGQSSDPGILGGQRDVFVQRITPPNNSGIISVDSSQSFTGALAYASGPNTAGFTQITYDGNDASSLVPGGINFAPGLNSLDLTSGGGNIQFLFGSSSDLGAVVSITVYSDSAANFSRASVVIPATASVFNFVPYYVPFANFVVAGGTGANFTNVDAIVVLIDGRARPSTDVGLNFFAAVPEPGTLALMGLGVLALGRFTRRGKQQII